MLSIGDHNTLRQFSTLYFCYRSSFESFSTLTNNYQDLSNGNKRKLSIPKKFHVFLYMGRFQKLLFENMKDIVIFVFTM